MKTEFNHVILFLFNNYILFKSIFNPDKTIQRQRKKQVNNDKDFIKMSFVETN